LGFIHIEAASLNKAVSFTEEMNTLLDVVDEIYVSVSIATIDQRQLESRARVAAVENYE
jgi:hypothetical protein